MNLFENVAYAIQRKSSGDGWGDKESTEIIETGKARIVAQSGGEQVNAQQLGRESTHRFYVRGTIAKGEDEILVLDGDYAGKYIIRFVDVRKAGSLKYTQIDAEYKDALQAEINADNIVTYNGEPVFYEGEFVTYA